MLKLIKYEFRKNLAVILGMLMIIAAAQAYFMYGYLITADRVKAVGGMFAVGTSALVCFFMVFTLGIMTYSRELSSKTSYLVFMTPNNTLKIVGSKLLFTFICGIFVAIVLLLLGTIDVKILYGMFDEEISYLELISSILSTFGFKIIEIVYSLVTLLASFLIQFFMIVTLAYLSITLTATVLQNKKIKNIISIVLFLAVVWLVTKLGGMLPTIYDDPDTLNQAILSELPKMLLYAAVMIASVFGTAYLLDRKVSL